MRKKHEAGNRTMAAVNDANTQASPQKGLRLGGAGLPAHEMVYRRLREMILFGDLTPGQAVTIQGLTARLGVGMTPVREAIRRLVAAGALESTGNRRVSVPRLTTENVQELIFARLAIEAQLIRLATAHVTPDDLQRLADMDAALDRAIQDGDVGGYLRHNYSFHEALYDLAEAPILRDLALGLWLRFGPSLRVVCGRFGTSNLSDQHKETLDAMAGGNGEAAALAIQQDVLQGMDQIAKSLRANSPSA